ncbi:molybdopterin molybdotransferase MoeA [Herbiconiux sp. CPCC 205763]|uniref:Molybdopterin molybdenumtransferase n=1 Tax=Herbiconiux aconitum TaxID=2970913 RepID=A0ABT2GVK5_9MICO|nr:gephyrin-like molybdotransferase Glp [Herbiconiux aconitum]MCS5718969.1 molybdopterin molybdotransferase MoeA [Herbiconiux aconitum]
MRTIEHHRSDVTTLVGGISGALEAEILTVSGDALTAHPERYAHRVLASDVLSPSSLPAFDNSQMDGFAVRSADLGAATAGSPVTLPVAARIAAGDSFARHAPGTATPIMTGAAVPEGADAVIPVESADPPVFPAAAAAASVRFGRPVAPGAFVRVAGSDITSGQILLRAGSRLGPAQFGVVAGTGATSVPVRRRPRVLLVSTGHEIRDPGSELQPGQIFDANTVALTAALQSIGCAVTAIPCRSDDAADLLEIVVREAPGIDLVVTVGGVSAGAREVVRDAFEKRGVRFEKVAVQPGGPQGFGLANLPTPVPVVCLPGNPVSALVSFEAFLRPAILSALGVTDPLRELRHGRAAHAFESPASAHQLRRGIVHDDGTLELVGGPSSHLLHSYAESTVLVHVPVGVSTVTARDELDYWRIDG